MSKNPYWILLIYKFTEVRQFCDIKVKYSLVQYIRKSGLYSTVHCTGYSTGGREPNRAPHVLHYITMYQADDCTMHYIVHYSIWGKGLYCTPCIVQYSTPGTVQYNTVPYTRYSTVQDLSRNPGNPLAHYDITAEEILAQCGGKVSPPSS